MVIIKGLQQAGSSSSTSENIRYCYLLYITDDLMRQSVSRSTIGVSIQNGEVDSRPLTDRELVLVLTQIVSN